MSEQAKVGLFPLLFKDTEGVVEGRSFNRETERQIKGIFTRDSKEFSAWVRANRDNNNLYFGVCTRKPGATHGRKEDCYEAPAYWADLDFKDFAGGEQEARMRLASCPLSPSVVVRTGGGLQAFWIFKEPEVIGINIDLHEARLKAIALSLGGDRVWDMSRIMRIPGTTNFPTEKKRRNGRRDPAPCVIESITEFLYNPSDFDELVPQGQVIVPVAANFSPTSNVPAKFQADLQTDTYLQEVFEGMHQTFRRGTNEIDRSRMDAKLAKRLIHHRYTDEEIAPILMQYPYGKMAERHDPEKYLSYVTGPLRKHLPPTAAPIPLPQSVPLQLTTLSALYAEPEVPMDWVVEDLLLKGGVSLLVAKPKVGKSTLARQLALCVARGSSFLGRKTALGSVIYLALEERRGDVCFHFHKMGATGQEPIKIYVGSAPTDVLVQIRQIVEVEHPVLVIVDTLIRFIKLKDSNDYAQASVLFEPVLALARETNTHVALLHHARKGETAGIDSALGSTAFAASVDTILVMSRGENSTTIQSIQRLGVELPPTELHFDPATMTSTLGVATHMISAQRLQDEIIEFLMDQSEPVREDVIDKEVTGKTAQKRKTLRQLVKDGLVVRVGDGKQGAPYLYAVREEENCQAE